MTALPALSRDSGADIEPSVLPGGAALVTATYAPDFERCRLLCETADRHVSGISHHYLLVEPRDVPVFRQLQSPRRTVVDERDLLPGWLRPIDDPLSLFRRRIWLSLRTKPLRGWHVQQLRRIAIAEKVSEQTLIYCDSDVAFLKPFDLAVFRRNGAARLFRRPGALSQPSLENQRVWSANAGVALGLPPEAVSRHDYISTLIGWDRSTVLAMCRHMETVRGRDWVTVIGETRKFSECMLYGRYVDEVIREAGHFHGEEELCRVYWNGDPMSDTVFRDFVATMRDEQVAVGMQSFIGTDIARIRRLVLG